LLCFATLCGTTAISFARRSPDALLFAYPTGAILVLVAAAIFILIGVTGYDVDKPGVFAMVAATSAFLGCITIVAARALDRGAA
jgi:hypothetical protein